MVRELRAQRGLVLEKTGGLGHERRDRQGCDQDGEDEKGGEHDRDSQAPGDPLLLQPAHGRAQRARDDERGDDARGEPARAGSAARDRRRREGTPPALSVPPRCARDAGARSPRGACSLRSGRSRRPCRLLSSVPRAVVPQSLCQPGAAAAPRQRPIVLPREAERPAFTEVPAVARNVRRSSPLVELERSVHWREPCGGPRRADGVDPDVQARRKEAQRRGCSHPKAHRYSAGRCERLDSASYTGPVSFWKTPDTRNTPAACATGARRSRMSDCRGQGPPVTRTDEGRPARFEMSPDVLPNISRGGAEDAS